MDRVGVELDTLYVDVDAVDVPVRDETLLHRVVEAVDDRVLAPVQVQDALRDIDEDVRGATPGCGT